MKKIPPIFLTNPLRVFIGPWKLSFSPMTWRYSPAGSPSGISAPSPWERPWSIRILPPAAYPAHHCLQSPGTHRLHIPPSLISKNNGHKCMFFPTVPKNHRKILGSHRIFLWIGHISLFSLCMSKNCWNFGHNRKKPPSMTKNKAGGVLKCSL